MPAPLQVRELTEADVDQCGELLAARHRADRGRLPFLDAALEDPGVAAEAVRGERASPFTEGAVAVRLGRVVGFCVATRLFFAPTDMAAQFVPPRSVAIPVVGHAVADGEDATEVYRALYAHLAGGWVSDGLLTHRIDLVPGDRDAEEAWVSLGFGRTMTAATRATAVGVEGPEGPAGLRIDQATPEDLETVLQLSHELMEHHRQSPMFWPYIPEAQPALRRFLEGSLVAGTPTFLAWEGNRPVGMQSFLLPGFTPPTVRKESRLYLFEGVVSRAVRGGGVGTAMLRAAMAWAAGAGHELCTLHWASGNYSGVPFWREHGFVPVQHAMERRIDERALWARGNPGHTD
jgi:GNAT superfamily N-acetyltransferase